MDRDGFQINVNQQDEEIFSTCTSKTSAFDFYSNTGTPSDTTAATWPDMDLDIQRAPIVTPTSEEDHIQNRFFPSKSNANANENLDRRGKQKQLQEQVDISISPPKHVNDFDTYHDQDGLDDSTVGTAISRRHLLRNRANAFLQYASSVEHEHQQKQQQQWGKDHNGKYYSTSSSPSSAKSSAYSSPVSMLIKGKNKVKSMSKGIGITRTTSTSTSTSPRKKKGFKLKDDGMEEEQQQEQQQQRDQVKGQQQQNKNASNPRTGTRIRRSEKIEQFMIKTMSKDKIMQSQANSLSNSMPMVENIGMGLSPIQHDKKMSSIDTVENDEGTRLRAHHVQARNLNSGENSLGLESGHGNAKTSVNGNKRLVGLYKLSHESMRLDEANAFHANTVDRCSSMDSSKSGLGISTLSRRLVRFGDISKVESQAPLQSQSQAQGILDSTAPSQDSMRKDVLTPVIDKTKGARARMDRYNPHDEMSPLLRSSRFGDVSEVKSQDPSLSQLQSQAQGTLNSTAPSQGSVSKDIFTPANKKKKGASACMDRYNSHDEMSPLVVKRQVSDHSAVSAISSCRLNRLPPTGARKLNMPKQKFEVSETDLGDIPMHSESSVKKEIQSSESSDPIDKLSQQRHVLHISAELPNPGNSVAEKAHPPSSPAKESHRTPPKAAAPFHSGPFLDRSWQPSPIQPGGSFAIFDDSHVDEVDRNSSPVKSMAQQGYDISSSPQVMYQPQEQSEFMTVVASIVIQTFFRRHLAYKITCERYVAVLNIQRFLYTAMERRETNRMALGQTTHLFYDLASTQIQAAWRGFWVRDCINVESYCACTIQKAFRSYWGSLTYKFDIYRILIAQSVARRYLMNLRMKKKAAATLIQSNWRGYAAKEAFVNMVTDVLIVQSVCRRFLVKKNVGIARSKRSQLQRSQPMTNRDIMKNMTASHSMRTIKTGTTAGRHVASNVLRQRRNGVINQLNTDDLIRKWKNRRNTAHMGEC